MNSETIQELVRENMRTGLRVLVKLR